MKDFADQVLDAFVLLTPDQRQAALELLRLLAGGAQKASPSHQKEDKR